jgi:2-polyprenyl-6-methoxyphenol hydroxylase-like FAD-dependent oxidoreductase
LQKTDVLIVGAGPTGLTLGCVLDALGVDFEIIDKVPARQRESSRATTVHASTLELLDRLGRLGEEIAVGGSKAKSSTLWSGGRRIARLYWDRLPTAYAHMLNLPQSETERLLRSKIRRGKECIHWGIELTGLTQDDDGVDVAVLRDATPDRVRARYVIGCDGAHSSVRGSLGVALEGKTHPERFLLADVTLDTPLDRDGTHVFVSTSGVLGIMPMPGGVFRLNGTLAGEEELDEAALIEMVRRRLGEDARTVLEKVHWCSDYQTHCRIVRTMQVGRVFLAGDAAHLNSPVGGQGMNLGIQDAFNLGWKLGYHLKGQARAPVLESYELDRLHVVTQALAAAERSTRMIAARHPLERTLRNAFVFVAHRLPPVQRQLTWVPAGLLHRYPSLASNSDLPRKMRSRVSVGDRLPNVELGSGWLHRHMTGLSHDLLVVHVDESSDRAEEVRKLNARYGPSVQVWFLSRNEEKTSDDVIGDPEERVAEALGLAEPAAVLVRPDGFVDWIGRYDIQSIASAFAHRWNQSLEHETQAR